MINLENNLNQKFFEQALDQSPVSILITDVKGNIEYVNSAFTKTTGYRTDEVIGKNPRILNSGEHNKDFFKHLWKTILNGSIWKGEILNRKKDGTLYWENEIISAVYNNLNQITHFVCTKEDITQLVNARNRLKESEEQSRLLADNIGDVIWIISTNWNFSYVSPSVLKATGYNDWEIKETKFEEYLIDTDLIQQIYKTQKEDKILDMPEQVVECRLKRKDGAIIWIESKMKPFIGSDGQNIGIIGVSRDITIRKNAEFALIGSETRFKSFFKQSNAVILVVDPITATIIEANKAALEYYGYSLEEFQMLNLKNEFIGFLEAVRAEASENSKEKRNIYNQKHRLKNQQLRDVELYPARVMQLDKSLIYIIVHDITQRKKAVEALKESESKKLALLKIIPDLIFVINANAEFVDVYSDNPELLGIEPYKLLGKKVHYFFPAEMSELLTEKIKLAIETREVQTFEFRYKRDTGRYVSEEVRTIATGDGEVLVIIRDVSKQKNDEIELKKAWEEAEEANRLKGVFLANISHEIRTPINAILGFSDLLSDELKNTAHQQYIEAIKASSKTLLNLINDLLDLSKIEAGKMNISYSETNIPAIFLEIENIFSIKLREKKLEYKCSIDPLMPTDIWFDELRLKQILLNLIGNAIKFTDRGKVEVSVNAFNIRQTDNKKLVDFNLSVMDTGIGIDVKNQQEIFDAFKQQDTQDARKYGGTGLGLAITKRLVEMLNGKIELESMPAKGSLFSVTFKDIEVADKLKSVPISSQAFNVGKIIFKPRGILIADDVSINRAFLKGIFKGSDITFYEAENGEEAIEIIKTYKPSVALLDLRMPIIDGLGVAMFIKTNDDYKNIFTIGISATMVSYEADSRSCFLDEFISKPVDINKLLKRLAKYIPIADSPEITNDEIITNELPEIDKLSIEKFIHFAYSEMHPLIEKITHTSSFADYELFSKILIEKGSELKIKKLTYIGCALGEAVKCFDLDTISKLIGEYKNFEKSLLEKSDE